MSYTVGQVVTVKNPTIKNQVGGTDSLQSTVQARITKTFNDNEIGQRYIGELIKEEEIEKSVETGKTDYTPEHYKQYGEKMYQDTLENFNNYDPKKVFFGQFDILNK